MKTLKNITALFAALTLSAIAQKISERTAITGSAVDAAADVIGIVDTSAGTAGSKKILLSQFVDIPSFFGSVSKTELLYLDGVTSAIQTQLNSKAPLASPTFTGTVNADDITVAGTVTTANMDATFVTGNGSGLTALNANNLSTGTVPSARMAAVVAVASADIDWSAGTVFTKTLSGNTTFTFSNIAAGKTIYFRLTGQSPFGINWPSGITWGTSTPPLGPSSGVTNVYQFTADSGATVRGFVSPQQGSPVPAAAGGTGASNTGTLTNASNTTITGGGTLELGGFTLTVPGAGSISGTNTGDNAVNSSSAPARRLLTGVGPHTAVAGERLTLNNTSTVARINDPATGTVGQLYTVIIQAGTTNFNGTGQVFAASRLELVRVCNATNVWSSSPSVVSDSLQVGSNSWDGSTLTGAQAFSSTTRPTSAGTGTPAATSLITLTDGDARYSRFQEVIQTTAETSAANTTTYADSTQCALALGVGTYIIETWQQVEGLGSTGSSKTRLRWDGTATASGLIFLANASTLANLQNLIPILAQDGSRAFNTEIAFNYSSNRGGVVQLRFKFVVTVAGTLYIQYAPAVAVSGQTAQISVGSYITAIRTN